MLASFTETLVSSCNDVILAIASAGRTSFCRLKTLHNSIAADSKALVAAIQLSMCKEQLTSSDDLSTC